MGEILVLFYRRPRLLRTYRRIAQKDYHCCECEYPIFSGKPYLGEVWLIHNTIDEKRCHTMCPEDPNDDRYRQEDEEVTELERLSAAA
jgi:hypothetical protein